MSLLAKYNWLPQDTAAICALQTIGAAGNLILNGTLSVYNNPVISLVGLNRQVSITSTGNLSGVNFTVTGTYLGQVQTQTIAGPDNDTVETTDLFHTITSVSTSGAVATNVSVGTGASGHTEIYIVDNQSTINAVSAQVIVTSGSTNLTYTFLSSLQPLDVNFNVENGSTTMYNMNATTAGVTTGSHGMLPIVAYGTGAPTYNIPVYGHIPIKNCWIEITGTLGENGSLLAYILQQGLT
jgi:hypothetical protein